MTDALQQIEVHFMDKCNHETETMTEDYQKHQYFTLAAKAAELATLIMNLDTLIYKTH